MILYYGARGNLIKETEKMDFDLLLKSATVLIDGTTIKSPKYSGLVESYLVGVLKGSGVVQ